MGQLRLYVSSMVLVMLIMARSVHLLDDKGCSDDLKECETIEPLTDVLATDSFSSSDIRRKRNFLSNEFTANMIGRRLAGPILDAIYEEDEESPWLEAPIGDLFSMLVQMGGKAIEGDKYLGFEKPKVTKKTDKPAKSKSTGNIMEDVTYDDYGIEDVGSTKKGTKNNKVQSAGSTSTNSDHVYEDDDEIMDIPNKQTIKLSSKRTNVKSERSFNKEDKSTDRRPSRNRQINRHHQPVAEREDYSEDYYNRSPSRQDRGSYSAPATSYPSKQYPPNAGANCYCPPPNLDGNRPMERDEFGHSHFQHPSVYGRGSKRVYSSPPIEDDEFSENIRYQPSYKYGKNSQISHYNQNQDPYELRGSSQLKEVLPIDQRFSEDRGGHSDDEYLDTEYEDLEDI